jgi:cell division protein FtsL
MPITADIKTILTVGGIIAVLGGFYYSTQYRLESLEAKIESIDKKVDTQAGELNQLRKQTRKRAR